jgi:hypothetical protein
MIRKHHRAIQRHLGSVAVGIVAVFRRRKTQEFVVGIVAPLALNPRVGFAVA